jgi:hypothetical protein
MTEATLPGGKRTALTLVLLAAHFLFAVLGAAVAAWAITQFYSAVALEDRQLSEDVYVTTMAVRMILFCVCGIAFLAWLHRSYSNAQILGFTKSSPAMITFSIFIPFVQLVRPYQGIQEMWRNSETRPAVAPKNSKRILAWWLFFLAWESIFFITLDEMPEETSPSFSWWIAVLIGDACAAVAAALGCWMVLLIRRRQKNQMHARSTQAYAIGVTPLTYPT